jgi:hypothetical protein
LTAVTCSTAAPSPAFAPAPEFRKTDVFIKASKPSHINEEIKKYSTKIEMYPPEPYKSTQ